MYSIFISEKIKRASRMFSHIHPLTLIISVSTILDISSQLLLSSSRMSQILLTSCYSRYPKLGTRGPSL